MLKKVESSLVYALNAVKNNSFKGEVITFDLKADGVGYSTVNPAMSSSIKNKLEAVKKQIINGDIKIAPTHDAAKRLPGFPKNLRAIDD